MLVNRIISAVALLFFVYTSVAQDGCEIKGDFYIYKQSEIDRFAIDYPGCTSITGDLIIEEYIKGVILNLEGLSQLTKVEGSIQIQGTYALSNLDGLDNIDTIGKYLSIENNYALTDINGITSLKELKSGLYLRDLPLLQEIDTFLFLDTLTSLLIQNIPNLKNLSGFSPLQHISLSCWIRNIESLVNLDGLNQLHSVGGSLVLETNNNLLTLEGLDKLTHLGGLTIKFHPKLQDLTGLDSLNWINSLYLELNDQLNSIQQLEDLIPDSLSRITIKDNPLLSQCQILPICLAYPHTEEYPEIENNGAGCSTPLDLILSCGINGSCPQDVFLLTQADVDHFAEVYPGCDSIYGDLNILSNTITNLHGLAQLSYIGGKLYVYGNDQLTTLDGLEQVASIDGAIEIYYNPRLQSISGLSGLQKVQNGFTLSSNDSIAVLPDLQMFNDIQGDCRIGYNASLHNINALRNLRTVGGDLRIYANPVLLSLTGLENLEVVGGALGIEEMKIEDLSPLSNLDTIHGQLIIRKCPQLRDLNGLENLRSLKSLHISQNIAIVDLNGLNNIPALAGFVEIHNNDALISISGLAALQQVEGRISIKHNPVLQQMSAFHPLAATGGFILENNPQLTSLEGFDDLLMITGNLIIKSMPGLTSLHGLHQVQSIQGAVEISLNDFLLSLDGLEQLNDIGGRLYLKDNNVLNSLLALDALDSIGGDFVVENCGLTKLDDFLQLKSIGGELNIFKNPDLALISGFEKVSKMGGLYVASNPVLTDFFGLSELSSLTGTMEISNNKELTQLTSLPKLIEVDTTIRIRSNNKLKRIEFLDHLQRVRHLDIYQNAVDSLFCRSLKQVHGNLDIVYCTYLDGIYMDSLTRIGGDIYISSNGRLDSLGSFRSLVETNGGIRISDNSNLLNLETLSSLQRFKGRLMITGNEELVTIEGLRNVERSSFYVPENYINQDLFTISGNDDLSACAIPAICEIMEDPTTSYYLKGNQAGCSNSTEIQAKCGVPNSCLADSIIFDSQASIDAFPGNFPGCTFVTGKVIIEESQPGDILNLDSLYSINRIGGDLVIRNNVQLTELNGLDMLSELGGALWVQNNASLKSLIALQNLAPHVELYKEVDREEFVITDNSNLSACGIPFVCNTLIDPFKSYSLSENKNGCSTVAEVQEFCDYPTECELGIAFDQEDLKHFRIRYPKCTHLTQSMTVAYSVRNLSPLSLIESVDGGVYITNVSTMESLDGLDNLRRLNGPLSITSNASLDDISALSQIDPSTLRRARDHFELSGNSRLSACAIQSVCQIVENPELMTTISSNGISCKTREEILINCTVGILTPDENLEIVIYPNPATDQIHIASLTDLHHEIISVAIVDINGSIRSTSPYASSMDIGHLSPGLYVLVLQSRQHGLLTHRFVIAH